MHLVFHKEPGSSTTMLDVGPGSGILSITRSSEDPLTLVLGDGIEEKVPTIEVGVGDKFLWHGEVREIIAITTFLGDIY